MHWNANKGSSQYTIETEIGRGTCKFDIHNLIQKAFKISSNQGSQSLLNYDDAEDKGAKREWATKVYRQCVCINKCSF